MNDIEKLISIVIDEAFQIHKNIGPGLLESAYEAVLSKRLNDLGFKVERQKQVAVEYDGVRVSEGFRLDMLVNDWLIIELKSVKKMDPIFTKQVLTYLRLINQPIGLLINFGTELFKDGVKRVVNNYKKYFKDFPE